MASDIDNTRRTFLLAAAGAPIIMAAPEPAPASEPEQSAIELVNYHLRELVKAIEAADPTVNYWRVSDFTPGDGRGCAILFAGWRE